MIAKIKPSKGAPYARIMGVGGYRPTRVVPNEVILETIDSSDEWIRSRSGIATRHWASPEETVAAMSVEAAGKAIADAGITAGADRRRDRLDRLALQADPGRRHRDRRPDRRGQGRPPSTSPRAARASATA